MKQAQSNKDAAHRYHARGQPVPIGKAIQRLVGELGIGPTLAQYDIFSSWPEVVGERIAEVTVPEHFERRVLYVKVSSSTWRAELTMRRREIIEKLNSRMGTKWVKDICFR